MASYEDHLSNWIISVCKRNEWFTWVPPKWFLIKCGNPWNMVWFLKTCFGLNLLILLVKHIEIHVWFFTNLTLYWWSNLIFLLEEKILIKGFCEEWRLSICSYFPSKGSGFILCKSYLYIFPHFPVTYLFAIFQLFVLGVGDIEIHGTNLAEAGKGDVRMK